MAVGAQKNAQASTPQTKITGTVRDKAEMGSAAADRLFAKLEQIQALEKDVREVVAVVKTALPSAK